MYKYQHFLGYGVIVPAHTLKKSPYSVECIENRFRDNVIYLDYDHSLNSDIFIGYLLDIFSKDFQLDLKAAEKNINSLFYEILKMDIPKQYTPTLFAKHGDIWEEE